MRIRQADCSGRLVLVGGEQGAFGWTCGEHWGLREEADGAP